MVWKWVAMRGDPCGVVLDLGDCFLSSLSAHTAHLSGQNESSQVSANPFGVSCSQLHLSLEKSRRDVDPFSSLGKCVRDTDLFGSFGEQLSKGKRNRALERVQLSQIEKGKIYVRTKRYSRIS